MSIQPKYEEGTTLLLPQDAAQPCYEAATAQNDQEEQALGEDGNDFGSPIPGPWAMLKNDWRGCSCSMLKWRLLAVVTLLMVGPFYVYDLPGALGMGPDHSIQSAWQPAPSWNVSKTEEQSQGSAPLTHLMNQLLYSGYRLPNVFLAFYGAPIFWEEAEARLKANRHHQSSTLFPTLRKSLVILTGIALIGSMVFTVGVQFALYPLLMAGHILAGIAGEVLFLAQNALVARWYPQGKGLFLALSATLSCGRGLGSCMCFFICPWIAQTQGPATASLSGVVLCGVSFASAVVCCWADARGESQGWLPKIGGEAAEEDGEEGNEAVLLQNHEAEESKQVDATLHHHGFFRRHLPSMRELRQLGRKFWLFAIVVAMAYAAVLPLIGISRPLIQAAYPGASGRTAGNLISLFPFWETCGGLAIVGSIVELKWGRFSISMLLGSLGLFVVHGIATLFPWLNIPGSLVYLVMGVVSSFLYGPIWSALPYVFPSEHFGNEKLIKRGMSIVLAMQNAALGLWPIVMGLILDAYTSTSTSTGADVKPPALEAFIWTEIVLFATSIIAVVACLVLIFFDSPPAWSGMLFKCSSSVNNGLLTSTVSQRTEKIAEMMEQLMIVTTLATQERNEEEEGGVKKGDVEESSTTSGGVGGPLNSHRSNFVHYPDRSGGDTTSSSYDDDDDDARERSFVSCRSFGGDAAYRHPHDELQRHKFATSPRPRPTGNKKDYIDVNDDDYDGDDA